MLVSGIFQVVLVPTPLFALWLANYAVLNANVGESACLRGEAKRMFKKVLVINYIGNNSWSFMLLSKC
ncbi:MAG: hypothetical protein IPF54_02250 [Draconibacterium sp.]|nr:hypothetical protein [Draconibacterium sp.]